MVGVLGFEPRLLANLAMRPYKDRVLTVTLYPQISSWLYYIVNLEQSQEDFFDFSKNFLPSSVIKACVNPV